MEGAFKVISVFSDNVHISIDENMDYDTALSRYKDLVNLNDVGDNLECFVFLVRGDIIKNNNIKGNKNV